KRYAAASDAGTSTFYFDAGNVLYSKLRPYLNKVAIPDETGIATTELIPLRPDPKILNPRFLAHYLRSPGFVNQASHHVAGAKMPRVVMDWFWEHEAPIPSSKEQSRIVELLDQADRLRRIRREADAKAARILPALFLKMFGDPATNSAGWPVSTIGDLATLVTSGSTPRGGAEVYVTEGPYIIRSQNVLMNYLRLSDAARITTETHQQMSRTWVQEGDVLLNITGASIGRVAWVKVLDGPANVNQHVCIVRPNPALIDPAFLSACLSLPSMQTVINDIQTGASRQALNHVQVRGLRVPVPPVRIQAKFSEQAKILEECVEQSDMARESLDRLWATMMQRAFSGLLTAQWREAHMEELLVEMAEQARVLNFQVSKELEALS
ncbi:MAG: restriction endonuclease subunit S, partial [Rubrivivax sp.]